jgi:hypothetical protein
MLQEFLLVLAECWRNLVQSLIPLNAKYSLKKKRLWELQPFRKAYWIIKQSHIPIELSSRLSWNWPIKRIINLFSPSQKNTSNQFYPPVTKRPEWSTIAFILSHKKFDLLLTKLYFILNFNWKNLRILDLFLTRYYWYTDIL